MKVLLILMFFCFPAVPARAAEITIAAAANLQFTLRELQAEFTKETGIHVKIALGSSGSLATQIENGAPFDVFLSADMKYPQAVYKEGFSSRPPQVYAYGILVLWTMRDLDMSQGLGLLAEKNIKKIALPDPRLAPYGRQAVNAMKYRHLYPLIAAKLIYGESISQTNVFITTGAADIGFTAESVVLAPSMTKKGKWIEVSPQSYKPIAQGMVVLKYGEKNHARQAQAFYNFLLSDPARKILKKYGYRLIP